LLDKILSAMRNKILPYLFLAIGFISLSSVFLVKPIVDSMQEEVETTSRVIARLFSVLLIPATEEYDVARTIRNVMKDINFPIVVVDVNGTVRVYKPLLVKNVCLKCHGSNVKPEIKEVISKKYPKDKAINLKLGTLRGAIVAEIKK